MIVAGIICDKCGDSLVWMHVSKQCVIFWACEKGWSVGKQCLCPKCCVKRKDRDTP